MKLTIISPEKTLFEGEVQAVFLPGTKGAFEVLSHHAPVISSLAKGSVSWRIGGELESIDIASGFMKFQDEQMSVCVEQ